MVFIIVKINKKFTKLLEILYNIVYDNHTKTIASYGREEWTNMVSMKDIAAACGVSVATVSKALNNQEDIGEETRQRVKKAAKELGYHPNASARALKTNRSYNLGVLYREESGSGLTHGYFPRFLNISERRQSTQGMTLLFYQIQSFEKTECLISSIRFIEEWTA